MSELFLKIVNMSISAGWVVLAVLILRLLLRKAPKWITVLMWGIVAVRLVCPFSIESVLSLMPSAETVSPEIMMDPMPTVHTGVPVINHTVNPIITGSLAPAPGDSVNPLQIWIPILSAVWLIGVVVLLVYTLISYIRLRLRVRTAVSLRDNVYESENVSSPFILGVIRPRIYLPFNVRSTDAEHVIAHEQAHIWRKDHLWKPIGYLLLAVHWFNPLVWLGYVLLCRDIELACDEKVVKNLDFDQRADYSQALLNCSVNRRMIAACPLAFGEVGVKDRVKSVLNYKRPAFWIIIIAIIASVIVAVCFLTDPKGNKENKETNAAESDNVTSGAITEPHTDRTNIEPQVQEMTSYFNEVKEKYPMYYGLDASKGLVVYIWQMSEDSYSCGLLPGSETEHTDEEIWSLHEAPATLAEMRTIVSSYSIPQNEVAIMPIVMPHSSYAYTIDEAYTNRIEGIFWFPSQIIESDKYCPIIDSAVFDIERDGKDEECVLRYGGTSGLFTFNFLAYENGELEYYNFFYAVHLDLSFEEESDGTVVLRGETNGKVYYADIDVSNGYIVLSGDKDIWYLV